MQRYISGFLPALIILATLGGSALAADVTLRVHHFLSPKSATHRLMLEPWARRVEKHSGGRIKVEIYPSMTLGGKPPELINQVRDGVVDIVWTLAGYTAGRFPRTEVFELPLVHRGNPVATNLAIRDLYESELKTEYEGLHPLLIHVHQGQAFHLLKHPVNRLEDLRGLKLRTPNRTGGWMIEALGAAPVGMPVPKVPLALSRGVIDGALLPFEVTLPLKVHEIVKYHMEFEKGERLGTAVFLFVMNKAKYESLPLELQQVIDRESGPGFAREMGKVWLKEEIRGREAALGHGNKISVIGGAELVKFRIAVSPVLKRWIKDVAGRGIDGKDLIRKARKAIAAHTRR